MNLLLRTSDAFIVIDHRPRQGIFYQPYTKDGLSKANLIHSFPTDSFTALLDSSGRLHLVTESQKNQVLYIHFEKGMPQKSIVLEDPNHYYDFKHFNLHFLNSKLHLFYSVKHPTGTSRSFMYQPLDTSGVSIATLIPTLPDNTQLKMLSAHDTLYMIYTDFEQDYTLKLVTLSSEGTHVSTLCTSTLPIIDFNCCLCDGILHVAYIKDAYGKQQVGYTNSRLNTELLLDTPRLATAPCIFAHAGYLWMTYPYGDKLFMLLSINNGAQFSASVPCSLTGPFTTYDCSGLDNFNLNATALHATVGFPLRLGVISAIDLNGIHPDLTPTSELELLLEGIRLSSPVSAPAPITFDPSPPIAPTAYAEPIFNASPLEPEPLKKADMDLKSAAKNFMESMARFDAMPK